MKNSCTVFAMGNPFSYSFIKLPMMLLLLSIHLVACSDVPRDVEKLIKISDNEEELIASIEHFKGDSLKTEALYFLLRNMPQKGTKKYVEINREKEVIEHDWSKYDGYDQAVTSRDKEGIRVVKEAAIPDLHQISAQFLIDNIEDAFAIWQKPWVAGIDFANFCEFILPYRDRFEPLTDNWRKTTREQFTAALSEDKQVKNNIKLCQQINDTLKSNFVFNYNYTLAAPYPSIARLQSLGQGPCPYMTSLTLFTMRAFGLPVARDYAPYWSNVHHFSSHEWNAVLGQDGQWYPFMGCEANPQEYKPIFQAPKVFREVYSQREQAIHRLLPADEIPDAFRRKDLLDVTDLYYPTGDLTFTVDGAVAKEKILYVAVYNQRQWRVVYWGQVKDGHATFKNMARGVVYQLMQYEHGVGYHPIGNPALHAKEDNTRTFTPSAKKISHLRLSTFGLGSLGSNDHRNPLTDGDSYTLNYWDAGEWKVFASAVAADGVVSFEGAPEGAIFTLSRDALNRTTGEQLFELVDGEQIFW